jgi:hypothetical protein
MMASLLAFLTSPFWFTLGLGLFIIRILADYVKVRWYHKWKRGDLSILQYVKIGKSKRIHLHHFLFGLALAPITWILFALNQDFVATMLAGLVAALIASEMKELILMEWGP